MRDVILHAFDWHYRDIEASAPRIAELGYGAVLFPPPLYSDEVGPEWWQRYQPRDYRVLRSYLGGKADLQRAIAALHNAGVRAYADIVFNHMANESRRDHFYFPGQAMLQRYASPEGRDGFESDRLYGDRGEMLFTPDEFNKLGEIRNWSNQDEVEEGSLGGLPDLDLCEKVLREQRACLAALSTLGFDGYRVDAMKHMPIEHLEAVFDTPELQGKFIFGETLTFNDREEAEYLWPIMRETDFPCYDFALQETLRRAFAPAGSLRELVDPAAFGQALPWWRAVTVSITHDIPHNEGFRGMIMQAQDEYLCNAYLMGRDGGVPLVYTDNNQSAVRHPEDRDRWAGAWQRGDTAAMLRFHNGVHGTPQRPLYEADGFFVFARGERGVVAINKTGEWQHPAIRTWGLRQGNYRCQIHGHEMQVNGDSFGFAIPPREVQMWLFEGE